MNEPRVALCLYGEVRGTKTCAPTIYENIVNQWNTDIFMSFNRVDQHDEERLRYFDKNVVFSEVYEKQDLNTVFPKSFYDKLIPFAQDLLKTHSIIDVNFVSPLVGEFSSLYIRLNWYRFKSIIEPHINEYDYYIITRPDHYFLYPLFDKSFLDPNYIIKYNGHDWSGANADFLIVPKNLVLGWLISNYEFYANETLQDYIISELPKRHRKNSETITQLIFEYNQYKIKTTPLSSFISADSANERTSFTAIIFNGKHYYKYETQYYDSLHNQSVWRNHTGWKDDGAQIYFESDIKPN